MILWATFLFLTAFLLCVTPPAASAADTAYDAVSKGLDACATEISLAEFGLRAEELSTLYTAIFCEHPEYFFVSRQYRYVCDANGYVGKLFPAYTYTGQELVEARAYLTAELDRIVAEAVGSGEGSGCFDRALLLHDYICTHFSYDESYSVHDVYRFLRERVGICQAYTGLYTLLLRRVGICVGYAVSAEMNHIWNQVYLDGDWYHVDVTWDDGEEVQHTWFLKSDAFFAADGRHYGYRSAAACDSVRFDLYGTPAFGDVNTDGAVNLRDLTALARALAGVGTLPCTLPAGDLNLDGCTDAADIACFLSRLFTSYTECME